MQNQRTFWNLVTNGFSLTVNIVVGLWYIPYLVNALGPLAYGIVPLALVINQYLNVFTISLTSAITRFYCVNVENGDNRRAEGYLNTSLASVAIFVVLCIPLVFLLVANLGRVFVIPSEYLQSAKLLFSFTLSSLLVSLFSSVINTTLYTRNRLDLMNYLKIIRVVGKAGLTAAFFLSNEPDIAYIGYSNFVTEIVIFVLSLILFGMTAPADVKLGCRGIDREKIGAMLAMSAWVIVLQLGDITLLRFDNFIVNRNWGTVDSGMIGAVSELSGYLYYAFLVVSTLFGPLILLAYSRGQLEHLKKLVRINSKFLGCSMAVVTGIVVALRSDIMHYWLGPEYEGYGGWLGLKVLPLPFMMGASTFFYLFKAMNRVRIPALVTATAGLLYIICAIIAVHCFSAPVDGVLWIGIAFVFLQSYLFGMWYYNRCVGGGESRRLISSALFLPLSFVAAYFSGWGSLVLFAPQNLFSLFLAAFAAFAICFAGILYLFPAKERKFLWSVILGREEE